MGQRDKAKGIWVEMRGLLHDYVHKSFNTQGTASRREYWMSMLGVGVLGIAIILLSVILHKPFLIYAYLAVNVIPWYAISVRRYRDMRIRPFYFRIIAFIGMCIAVYIGVNAIVLNMFPDYNTATYIIVFGGSILAALIISDTYVKSMKTPVDDHHTASPANTTDAHPSR